MMGQRCTKRKISNEINMEQVIQVKRLSMALSSIICEGKWEMLVDLKPDPAQFNKQ